MANALSGKSARQQAELAAIAQARQEQRLAEEKAKLDQVEAAQRLTRTGGRGMLSFVDEKLAKTFGGQAA